MIEQILISLLSTFIGALATYLILKKVSNDLILDLIDEYFDFNTLSKDEDFMKFCYMVGGLIGKGARSGIGMDKKLNVKQVGLNMLVDWWQRKQGNQPQETSQDRRTERDPLVIQ